MSDDEIANFLGLCRRLVEESRGGVFILDDRIKRIAAEHGLTTVWMEFRNIFR